MTLEPDLAANLTGSALAAHNATSTTNRPASSKARQIDPAKQRMLTLQRHGAGSSIPWEELDFKGDFSAMHSHNFNDPEGVTLPPHDPDNKYQQRFESIMKNWQAFSHFADGQFSDTPITAHGRYNAFNKVFENDMRGELKKLRDDQVKQYETMIAVEKDKPKNERNNGLIKACEERIKQIKKDHKEADKAMVAEFQEKRDKFVQHFSLNTKDMENDQVKSVAGAPKFLRDSKEGQKLLTNPTEAMKQKGGVSTKFTVRDRFGGGATSYVNLHCDKNNKVTIKMRIPKKMNDKQIEKTAKHFIQLSNATLDKDKPLTFNSKNGKLNLAVYQWARRAGWPPEKINVGFPKGYDEARDRALLESRIKRWESENGLMVDSRDYKRDATLSRDATDVSSSAIRRLGSANKETYEGMRKAFTEGKFDLESKESDRPTVSEDPAATASDSNTAAPAAVSTDEGGPATDEGGPSSGEDEGHEPSSPTRP